MDAETAESVIEDVFDALGTPGCRYEPPSGAAVEDLILIRHRRSGERGAPSLGFGRGGFTSTDRPQAIVVLRRQLAAPLTDGVFSIPQAGGSPVRFRIGEDPSDDDVHGFSLRCPVERL